MEYFSYPVIDLVVFSLGPLTGNWYGLFFEIGLLISSVLLASRLRGIDPSIDNDKKTVLIFACFFALLLGARMGYVLMYCPHSIITEPFYFIQFWDGCTSFAGAIALVIPVIWFCGRKWNIESYRLADIVVTAAPVAALAVLAGDIVVGSGWGKVAIDSPFSMLFSSSKNEDMLMAWNNLDLLNIIHSNSYGVLPRLPSQIIEFLTQILILIVVSLIYSKTKGIPGITTASYLIIFALTKILTEQFQVSDLPIGLSESLFVTKAAVLTLPLLVMSEIIILSVFDSRRRNPH